MLNDLGFFYFFSYCELYVVIAKYVDGGGYKFDLFGLLFSFH
jgi:hypothetical protein